MINEPIYKGILQSDLDCAHFNLLNFSGSGSGSGLPPGTVNVKTAPYNAAGDGVTDDSAAIQNAINAVFALGGGTVFFPKGIYLCNGAFDATTNSVLRFPYVPLQLGGGVWNNPVTIELLGEAPATVSAVPFIATQGSIIKCTKTGTGTAPAILAAYSYIGRAMPLNWITDFTYVNAVIRNLYFQTASNPTIGGVRLDSAAFARVEDCVIETADGGDPAPPEPTHGTTGLFMPGFQTFGSCLNRTWIGGFDTGAVIGDHFNIPRADALNCHVAFEFLGTPEFTCGNLGIDHCPTCVKFTKLSSSYPWYPMDLTLDIEQVGTGWQTPTATNEILDVDNIGTGEIRYFLTTLGAGPRDIGVTGGARLRLINTLNANTIYVGTDFRLVPITGGAKIQARNPGTNTWVDADQWTNP